MGNALEVEFDELLRQVAGHSFWLSYLTDAAKPVSPIGIHLAIFPNPSSLFVFSGKKDGRVPLQSQPLRSLW